MPTIEGTRQWEMKFLFFYITKLNSKLRHEFILRFNFSVSCFLVAWPISKQAQPVYLFFISKR